MGNLFNVGRIFYGLSIGAMGFLTIYYHDFPYMLIPPRHTWISDHVVLVDLSGALLLVAGASIALGKKAFLASVLLGTTLLLIFCFYFIPYELIASPKYMHFGDWENAAKELALAGGAFTIADRYSRRSPRIGFLNRLIPWGTTIYALAILSFAIDHYLYAKQAVAYMPTWISNPIFWLYFTGTALLGSSLAIILRIKPGLAAALLGTMIFIWVIIVHIPKVVATGWGGGGGEISSAFLALGYCGIAFIIAAVKAESSPTGKFVSALQ